MKMMNKYFYKVCKHCIKAHNIYERTANKDQPKYITEVNNEEMAKFMTDAMNKKIEYNRQSQVRFIRGITEGTTRRPRI